MVDKKKYYMVLGLRDGASQIEIKNAYKNLVSIYHPDVNKTPGAHKKCWKLMRHMENYLIRFCIIKKWMI